MSDQTFQGEQPRGTVGYTHKVNLGNYESAEFSMFAQFPITFGDEDGNAIRAQDAAFLVKSVVFSQLDIPTEVQDGVVVPKRATPAAAVAAAFPGATAERSGSGGVSAERPTAAPSVSAAAGSPVCPRCQGDLYDNRSKNVERAAEGKKAIPEGRCKQYADPPKGTKCEGIVWSWAKGV